MAAAAVDRFIEFISLNISPIEIATIIALVALACILRHRVDKHEMSFMVGLRVGCLAVGEALMIVLAIMCKHHFDELVYANCKASVSLVWLSRFRASCTIWTKSSYIAQMFMNYLLSKSVAQIFGFDLSKFIGNVLRHNGPN